VSPAAVAQSPRFTTGSAGLGDVYFPGAGNGGYDVAQYSLRLRYEPGTNQLAGSAELSATATQNLSQFNLDFRGFDISELSVDGLPADFTRHEQELVIVPQHGIRAGETFRVEVEYSGQPKSSSTQMGHHRDGFRPTTVRSSRLRRLPLPRGFR
jgi:aminopeptidase N